MVEPLIALCMVVRNDGRSLERALASARPFVDEINIGIDKRTTDPLTEQAARAVGADVWWFGHEDIGLSAEQWGANLIHFSNARNIGRKMVRAPWVLFLDSDEYIEPSDFDLRATVRRLMFTQYNSLAPLVRIGNFEFHDVQRIARAPLRWFSATHNQLLGAYPTRTVPLVFVQDTSLRTEEDRARREQQRIDGMVFLRPLAEKGDVGAVYHMAKHAVSHESLEEVARWATRYLELTAPHSELTDDRATLCLAVAQRYFNTGGHALEAEMWATRGLLDGPHADIFALLSAVAETRGDRTAAESWARAADLTPERARMRVR